MIFMQKLGHIVQSGLGTLLSRAVVHVLKCIYSEKATKFCKIFTLLLSCVVPVKSKVKILQNFMAFSKYMNFILRRS